MLQLGQIDRADDKPPYRQIASMLREAISSGLCTETLDLCGMYDPALVLYACEELFERHIYSNYLAGELDKVFSDDMILFDFAEDLAHAPFPGARDTVRSIYVWLFTDLLDISFTPDQVAAFMGRVDQIETQEMLRTELIDALHVVSKHAEEWKAVTKIASFDYPTLVTLWKTYNSLLMHLIENMNPATLGHVWRREDKDISLEALIHDYFAHMELHRDLFVERVAEIVALQQRK